jgi:type IV secretion system protein TrbL
MAAPGDCGNLVCEAVGGIGDAIQGAAGAVSYLQDPWGNTFKALQSAAAGMSKDILPALTSATLPDLSAEWFLNAYAISFATAIFVAIVLLIPQAVATARGTMAGRDLVESMGLYFGLFLVGGMFGPAVGMLLVSFFHSLSDVFVTAGVSGSVESINTQMQKMINEADPVGMTGGVVLATFLMLCMVIGLFMVLLVFLVQLVTLYFTGVLFPLGLVWIISKNKRQFGSKLAYLWLGLLAAHPLMFLLLGLAFSMMANQVGAFGNNFSLQSMVTLIVSVIALFMAALSPLALMKFAPVLPMGTGGTNGPSVSPGGSNSETIGPKNVTEASERYGRGDESEPEASSTSTKTSTSTSTSESATEGGSLSEISTARAGMGGIPGLNGAAGGVGAGAGTGSAAAAGGEAVAAEEAVAAAGVAESGTGVGAVIGIPTLIAAGAMAAGAKATELTEEAGEMATDAMDEPHIGQDSTS